MSVSDDIKRILWHEMGHLCVDTIKIETHNNLKVNLLNLTVANDGLFKWSGFVEMLPSLPFKDIPINHSILAYSLISLQAGCVFETIYFQIIKENSSINFGDCFSFNRECIGNGDWTNYHEILSKIREIHPEFRGKLDLNGYLEIDFSRLVNIALFKLSEFITKMNEIIDNEVIKIEKDFTGRDGAHGIYSYNYSGDELTELINRIIPLMNELGFRDTLMELHESFIKKFSDYIDKYDVRYNIM